jgi:pyruvate formate lyase activating enzyme
VNTSADQPCGLVFNIQRFSIHDGPGIRTTVFLKGCPLACPWCSNPESIRSQPEIITRDAKCIRCGRCVETCPQHAIEMTTDGRIIHFEDCNQCLECAKVCTARAIEQVGEKKSVAQVMDIVSRDASYYKRTGGGMTITGGEPLLQWEFSRELAKAASQAGILTALETTGFARWENFAKVLEFTDLVLFDLKQMDNEKHKKTIGVSNKIILENLQKVLSETNVKVWIRIPIIPSFNDSMDDLTGLGKFATSLPRPADKISLLPLHHYGEGKYKGLGRKYVWMGQKPPTQERLGEIKNSFEVLHQRVEIGR